MRRHDPSPRSELALLEPSSVARRLTVKPAMCGHNSLFVGQIGDWTWETVKALCGTDVFNARNGEGAPTYLSFYYFHIRASPVIHLRRFTFGDRIEVTSRAFNFGSESILVLHRIRMAVEGEAPPEAIDPVELYDRPRRDCLYVENFNRWVTRSREDSNQDLARSSPVDFEYHHLPALPDRYSPRLSYGHARQHHTFHDLRSPDYAPAVEEFRVEYPIDLSRDLNGVGLIYFAAYFSILDWAWLHLWRHLGRSDRSFLERITIDHKLCYLGNADADSILNIRMRSWRKRDDPGREILNAVIEDRTTRRTIAISTVHSLWEDSDDGVD